MAGYRFSQGMHIQFRGREYEIEERLPNGDIRLKDIAFNESSPVPESDLTDAMFEGELEFLGGPEVSLIQRKRIENFIDDLAALKNDDPRKIETKRREAYVKALDNADLISFSSKTVQPIIDKVHVEINDLKRSPHWKTVCYGWHKDWESTGRDLRVLTPHFEKRGNTKPRFSKDRKWFGDKFSPEDKQRAKDVRKIVDAVLKESFLTQQRLSVAYVYDLLDIRVAEDNRFREPDDQLPMPHRSSIYDIVRKMDEYEKDKARYGRRYADQKHRSNGQGEIYTRPLQRVEIDDTKLDLFVVDLDTRLPVGRPTLTFAIDCYSRMPLGFHIGFDGPGYLAVMQCLLHAVQKKNYLKELFPEVENDWETYGVPDEVVIDNGAAYISEDFTDAGGQLGTIITQSPVRHPETKPYVERSFGSVNRQLVHNQPGTTFSNIVDREDYDPEKNAVISFDKLMEVAHIFWVDIYAQKVHRGLQGIPAVAWKNGVVKYPPPLPRRQADLRILLGHVEHRKVGPSGIEFSGIRYNCAELSVLRGLKGQAGFKFNPGDISLINVFNPADGKYITTPALDQEYTKGLSLWQHKVIRRYVLKEMKELVDADSLRRAKAKIQRIVESEWLKSGKTGARAKMGRWYGIRQPDYNASLEIDTTPNEQQLSCSNAPSDSPMLQVGDVTSSGVSDPSHMLTSGSAEAVEDKPLTQPTPGTLDLLPAGTKKNPKNGRNKTTHKKKNGTTTSRDAVSDARGEGGVSDASDDDLDMTGFIGSYDLPSREN
jgi:putative transposase